MFLPCTKGQAPKGKRDRIIILHSGQWKPGQSGNRATQFKPGQSGNPLGHSAEAAALIKNARIKALRLSDKLIDELSEILRNTDDPRLKRDIINDLLNRGLGRPPQYLEMTVDESSPPALMTNEELAEKCAKTEEAYFEALYKSGKLKKLLEKFEPK